MLFVQRMRKLTICLGLTAWLATSTAALAADKAAPAAAQTPASSVGVKRDPNGVKGISPFVELINKGDRAYIARDFDGALAAYREAIQKSAQDPVGHYRAGVAQLAKGDQKEAEAAFLDALRFVGKDATLKAKLLFALADLRERQKNNDDAVARWKEYSKLAEEAREAITYPATATERVARNEAWKQIVADSESVKARIAKRLKEADEAARKSAADPQNK